MQPTVTLDPRDRWAHARRIEVYRYAKDLGVSGITEEMPKDLVVKRLKSLGHPPPPVPHRPIGKNMNPRNGDTTPDSHRGTLSPIVLPKPIETTVTIDADLLLEQAWAIEEQKLRQPAKELTWNEMRAELKAKGIKINRRWRMADVKAILDGKQDPT